ncbi:MAG: NAD-dependent epimerase/dehydratase family protein, partial [bacterium]
DPVNQRILGKIVAYYIPDGKQETEDDPVTSITEAQEKEWLRFDAGELSTEKTFELREKYAEIRFNRHALNVLLNFATVIDQDGRVINSFSTHAGLTAALPAIRETYNEHNKKSYTIKYGSIGILPDDRDIAHKIAHKSAKPEDFEVLPEEGDKLVIETDASGTIAGIYQIRIDRNCSMETARQLIPINERFLPDTDKSAITDIAGYIAESKANGNKLYGLEGKTHALVSVLVEDDQRIKDAYYLIDPDPEAEHPHDFEAFTDLPKFHQLNVQEKLEWRHHEGHIYPGAPLKVNALVDGEVCNVIAGAIQREYDLRLSDLQGQGIDAKTEQLETAPFISALQNILMGEIVNPFFYINAHIARDAVDTYATVGPNLSWVTAPGIELLLVQGPVNMFNKNIHDPNDIPYDSHTVKKGAFVNGVDRLWFHLIQQPFQLGTLGKLGGPASHYSDKIILTPEGKLFTPQRLFQEMQHLAAQLADKRIESALSSRVEMEKVSYVRYVEGTYDASMIVFGEQAVDNVEKLIKRYQGTDRLRMHESGSMFEFDVEEDIGNERKEVTYIITIDFGLKSTETAVTESSYAHTVEQAKTAFLTAQGSADAPAALMITFPKPDKNSGVPPEPIIETFQTVEDYKEKRKEFLDEICEKYQTSGISLSDGYLVDENGNILYGSETDIFYINSTMHQFTRGDLLIQEHVDVKLQKAVNSQKETKALTRNQGLLIITPVTGSKIPGKSLGEGEEAGTGVLIIPDAEDLKVFKEKAGPVIAEVKKHASEESEDNREKLALLRQKHPLLRELSHSVSHIFEECKNHASLQNLSEEEQDHLLLIIAQERRQEITDMMLELAETDIQSALWVYLSYYRLNDLLPEDLELAWLSYQASPTEENYNALKQYLQLQPPEFKSYVFYDYENEITFQRTFSEQEARANQLRHERILARADKIDQSIDRLRKSMENGPPYDIEKMWFPDPDYPKTFDGQGNSITLMFNIFKNAARYEARDFMNGYLLWSYDQQNKLITVYDPQYEHEHSFERPTISIEYNGSFDVTQIEKAISVTLEAVLKSQKIGYHPSLNQDIASFALVAFSGQTDTEKPAAKKPDASATQQTKPPSEDEDSTPLFKLKFTYPTPEQTTIHGRDAIVIKTFDDNGIVKKAEYRDPETQDLLVIEKSGRFEFILRDSFGTPIGSITYELDADKNIHLITGSIFKQYTDEYGPLRTRYIDFEREGLSENPIFIGLIESYSEDEQMQAVELLTSADGLKDQYFNYTGGNLVKEVTDDGKVMLVRYAHDDIELFRVTYAVPEDGSEPLPVSPGRFDNFVDAVNRKTTSLDISQAPLTDEQRTFFRNFYNDPESIQDRHIIDELIEANNKFAIQIVTSPTGEELYQIIGEENSPNSAKEIIITVHGKEKLRFTSSYNDNDYTMPSSFGRLARFDEDKNSIVEAIDDLTTLSTEEYEMLVDALAKYKTGEITKEDLKKVFDKIISAQDTFVQKSRVKIKAFSPSGVPLYEIAGEENTSNSLKTIILSFNGSEQYRFTFAFNGNAYSIPYSITKTDGHDTDNGFTRVLTVDDVTTIKDRVKELNFDDYILTKPQKVTFDDFWQTLEIKEQEKQLIIKVKLLNCLGRECDETLNSWGIERTYDNTKKDPRQILILKQNGKLLRTLDFSKPSKELQQVLGGPANPFSIEQIIAQLPPDQQEPMREQFENIHLTDNTLMLKPVTVTTPDGASWTDYYIVGSVIPVRIIHERHDVSEPTKMLILEKTLGIKWDVADLVMSFKLDTDNNILETYHTQGTVPASDLISHKIETAYENKYHHPIWDDLAKINIFPDTLVPLIKEMHWKRDGDSTRGFTYSAPDEQAVSYIAMIPQDLIGRDFLRQIPADAKNIDTVINQWWLHEMGETDAPLGILPGNITIHHDGLLGETKTFGRTDTVDGIKGYRYEFKNGNFKVSEFWTLNGQLYMEEWEELMSIISPFLPHTSRLRRIYYDLGVPYVRPDEVRDEDGKLKEKCLEIIYQEGKQIQKWERYENGFLGKIKQFLRLTAEKITVIKTYDQYGKSVPYPHDDFTNSLHSSLFQILISIVMLYPLFLIIRSIVTGLRHKRLFSMVKRTLADQAGDQDLLPEHIRDIAHDRLRIKVLLTEETAGEKGKVAKHDMSALFISQFRHLYAVVLSGMSRFNEGIDLKGNDERLINLDTYAQKFSRFYGGEQSREQSSTDDGGDSLYPDKTGIADEELFDKATLYYYEALHLLRDAIQRNDQKAFNRILNNYGIASGEFKQDHFMDFSKREGYHLFSFSRTGPNNIWAQRPFSIVQKFLRAVGLGSKAVPLAVLDIFVYFMPFAVILTLLCAEMFTVAQGFALIPFFTGLSVSIVKFLSIAGVSVLGGAVSEYLLMSRLKYKRSNLFRLLSIPLIISAYFIQAQFPIPFLGALIIKTFLMSLLYLEAFSWLVWNHSMLGLSAYRNLRPSIGAGRPRAVLMWIAQNGLFIILGILMGWSALPWFLKHFMSGLTVNVVFAQFNFMSLLYTAHYGLFLILTFIFASFRKDHGPRKIDESAIAAFKESDDLYVVNYVGPPLKSHKNKEKSGTGTEGIIDRFDYLLNNNYASAEALKDYVQTWAVQAHLVDNPQHVTMDFIKRCLNALFDAEKENDVSMWSLRQMEDSNVPEEALITVPADNQTMVRMGFFVKRNFSIITGIDVFDTGISIMDMAETAGSENMGRHFLLLPTPNAYLGFEQAGLVGRHDQLETPGFYPEYRKMCGLFDYLSGGGDSDFTHVKNPATHKSGAMLGMYALESSVVKRVKGIIILDRNANALQQKRWMHDLKRIISNPNIVVMPALRNTTNTAMPIGRMSYLVEGGHGYGMLGLNDKTGTGWENFMRIYDQAVLSALSNPEHPFMPLTKELQDLYPYGTHKDWYRYGLIGLGPNIPELSEDIADVWAQTHNLIGLGHTPQFALSMAVHRKLRERYSAGELGPAPPRWSKGLSLLRRFIFQIITDFGSESIFERDARRNHARFYITMPIALLNIALFPFNILLDWSPFTGITIALLFAGLLFNQSATLNGLGAITKGAGKIVGFLRWTRERLPDVPLFAGRWAMEAVAQIFSYFGAGYWWKTSGGGGEYDKSDAIKRVPNIILFRWVFLLGFLITSVNLFAFLFGLSITNAVALFISTFFGVSMMIGPYMSENKPGKSVLKGWGDIAALGAGAGIGIYILNLFRNLLTAGALWPGVEVFLGSLFFAGFIFLWILPTNAVKKFARFARLSWELIRGYVITISALFFVYIVPKPDVLRLGSFGDSFIEFTFGQLQTIALWGGGIFILVGVIGKLYEQYLSNKWRRKIVHAGLEFESKRSNIPIESGLRSRIEARLQDLLVSIGEREFKFVKQGIREIQEDLSPYPAAEGIIQPRAPPTKTLYIIALLLAGLAILLLTGCSSAITQTAHLVLNNPDLADTISRSSSIPFINKIIFGLGLIISLIFPLKFSKRHPQSRLPTHSITGANGAVGSQLISKLTQSQVTHGIKALVRARAGLVQRRELAHPDVSIITGDLLNIETLSRSAEDTDVIYHLGGWNGLGKASLIDALTLNSLSTALLTNLAEKTNQRIVFASSIFVYQLGDTDTDPIREDNLRIRPDIQKWLKQAVPAMNTYAQHHITHPQAQSPDEFMRSLLADNPAPENVNAYALSKLLGEQFIRQYSNGVVLRFSNVYGPGDDSDRTIPKYMRLLTEGNNATFIPGRILQFIYIDDVLKALESAGSMHIENENDQVINIADPQALSEEQVLKLIKDIVNSHADVIPMDPAEIEQHRLHMLPAKQYDTTKMKSKLGISPETLTLLSGGLEQTKRWLIDENAGSILKDNTNSLPDERAPPPNDTLPASSDPGGVASLIKRRIPRGQKPQLKFSALYRQGQLSHNLVGKNKAVFEAVWKVLFAQYPELQDIVIKINFYSGNENLARLEDDMSITLDVDILLNADLMEFELRGELDNFARRVIRGKNDYTPQERAIAEIYGTVDKCKYFFNYCTNTQRASILKTLIQTDDLDDKLFYQLLFRCIPESDLEDVFEILRKAFRKGKYNSYILILNKLNKSSQFSHYSSLVRNVRNYALKNGVLPDHMQNYIRALKPSQIAIELNALEVGPMHYIRKMRNTLQKQKSWDVIAVTTVDEKMGSYIKAHLEDLRGRLYPESTRVVVLPRDREMYNLDGTIAALQDIVGMKLNDNNKVLILHTAGRGTRNYPMTAYAVKTKALIEVPLAIDDNNNNVLTNLDQAIRQYHMLLEDTPRGTITIGTIDQQWAISKGIGGQIQDLQVFGNRRDLGPVIDELQGLDLIVGQDQYGNIMQKYSDEETNNRLQRILQDPNLEDTAPALQSICELGHIWPDDQGNILEMIEKPKDWFTLRRLLEKGTTNINWWNHRYTFDAAQHMVSIYEDQIGKRLDFSQHFLEAVTKDRDLYVKNGINSYIAKLVKNKVKQLKKDSLFPENPNYDDFQRVRDSVEREESDKINTERAKLENAWELAHIALNKFHVVGYIDCGINSRFEDTGINTSLLQAYMKTLPDPKGVVPRDGFGFDPIQAALLNVTDNVIASPLIHQAIQQRKLIIDPQVKVFFIGSAIKEGHIKAHVIDGEPQPTYVLVVNTHGKKLITEGDAMVWGIRGPPDELVVEPGQIVCDVALQDADTKYVKLNRITLPISEDPSQEGGLVDRIERHVPDNPTIIAKTYQTGLITSIITILTILGLSAPAFAEETSHAATKPVGGFILALLGGIFILFTLTSYFIRSAIRVHRSSTRLLSPDPV